VRTYATEWAVNRAIAAPLFQQTDYGREPQHTRVSSSSFAAHSQRHSHEDGDDESDHGDHLVGFGFDNGEGNGNGSGSGIDGNGFCDDSSASYETAAWWRRTAALHADWSTASTLPSVARASQRWPPEPAHVASLSLSHHHRNRHSSSSSSSSSSSALSSSSSSSSSSSASTSTATARLLCLVGDACDALLLDAGSGKAVSTLRGHRDHLFAAAFSPCGVLVATGGQDRSARVWDVRRTDRALHVLPAARGAVRALVYSRGGRWLAAGTTQCCLVRGVGSGEGVGSYGMSVNPECE
jgi:hypothetical protein